jgi:hypothetical protein
MQRPRGQVGGRVLLLTQVATSLRTATSSSGVWPGTSSGLRRPLSTAWASTIARATCGDQPPDCGDPKT